MRELVFLKLGGSLITDKAIAGLARRDIIRRLAGEVRAAREKNAELSLLLGHGSGSFGHFPARRYGTREGARSPHQWRGFAETAAAAARLNCLVTELFQREGVPVVPLQPSASARCRDGQLLTLSLWPIEEVLSHGLVPLLHGDVALDTVRGCTIVSTEELFAYLAPRLRPQRILLAEEVAGLYTADPHQDPSAQLIPEVTPERLAELLQGVGGARGIDVTGGMLTKVQLMCGLVEGEAALRVRLISGLHAGLVERALLEEPIEAGTLIHAGLSGE